MANIKQAVAIEGNNISEYVASYNKAMAEIAGCEIIKEEQIAPFALIVYYVKSDAPAVQSEQAEEPARECCGVCSECAYYEHIRDRFGEIDKRYKYGKCSATGGAHINMNMRACEMFRKER